MSFRRRNRQQGWMRRVARRRSQQTSRSTPQDDRKGAALLYTTAASNAAWESRLRRISAVRASPSTGTICLIPPCRFGLIAAAVSPSTVATDIGQGSTSILAYIVAEELGIQPGRIHLETADTTLTPVDLGSYSSRVTFMAGNAAIAAARKLK